eukprot:EG_transcript_32323
MTQPKSHCNWDWVWPYECCIRWLDLHMQVAVTYAAHAILRIGADKRKERQKRFWPPKEQPDTTDRSQVEGQVEASRLPGLETGPAVCCFTTSVEGVSGKQE